MATTKKLRYSLDEDQHTANWETGPDPTYDDPTPAGYDDVEVIDCEYDQPADPDYDDAGQPAYDEPAPTDYDQPADPDYGDEPAAPWAEEAPRSPSPPLPAPVAGFTYALGQAVRPATQQQAHPVVWQGYLKERHPATGLVQRVPVYQLRDGFWDCYREEELQAA